MITGHHLVTTYIIFEFVPEKRQIFRPFILFFLDCYDSAAFKVQLGKILHLGLGCWVGRICIGSGVKL